MRYAFLAGASHRLSSALFLIVVAGRIDELTPVEIAVAKSGYKRLCGSDIGRQRDVIKVTKTEQTCFCLAGCLLAICASEIEDEVDLIICYSGCNLLDAARASCKEGFDIESGCFSYVFSGCVSCANMVATENSAISNAKLRHQFFFIVFSNDCDFHSFPPLYVRFVSGFKAR